MNIPTTIAELRANVADLEGGYNFVCKDPHRCLVTLPLNLYRLGTERPLYSYWPSADRLRDPTSSAGEPKLGSDIANLTDAWDDSFPSDHIQSRDEALAWIDWYIGTLEA